MLNIRVERDSELRLHLSMTVTGHAHLAHVSLTGLEFGTTEFNRLMQSYWKIGHASKVGSNIAVHLFDR